MTTLHALLKIAVDFGGSDLHLTTGSPPQARVDGTLRAIEGPVLGPADTKLLAYSVLTEAIRVDLRA
jgi:twitching motility protein PilT